MSSKIDWATMIMADALDAKLLRLSTATNLTYSSNLNTVGSIFSTSTGDGYYMYNGWNGSGGTGQPSEQAIGMMLVMSSPAYNCCTQAIFTSSSIYIRRYASGGWSSWYKIVGTALS